ncbi:MAG: hypothetical protein HYV60_03765 [Planctomycetia bacterium]|nr:hypothetical protein [Planctomycetia bacterium]
MSRHDDGIDFLGCQQTFPMFRPDSRGGQLAELFAIVVGVVVAFALVLGD